MFFVMPISLIAMFSKPEFTKEEQIYTQSALENEKKQTDLLFNECKNIHANARQVLSFINAGADVNAIDSLGVTPLHYACAAGNLSVVKTLVENDANIEAKSFEREETPLFEACSEGKLEVVKYLVKSGALINVLSKRKSTPLHLACEFNYFNIIKFLIENGAEVNIQDINLETPLHLACDKNSLEIAKYLLEHGAYVNVKTKEYETTPLLFAIKNKNLHIIQLLLDYKADVNATNIYGTTPLMLAIFEKNIHVCELLLKANANINIVHKNYYNLTALEIAYDEKATKIIHLLKQYGAISLSEEEANKNMHNFIAELNAETLQKQQERQKRKETQKEEITHPQQQVKSTKIAKSPTVTEPVKTTTSPVTTETTATTSTTSTTSTTTARPISRPTTPPTIITSSTAQKKPIVEQEAPEYLILIDKKVNSLLLNQTIKDHITQLTHWPYHGLDVKKLEGYPNTYRLRVGGYRIIFSVDTKRHEIKIHEIGLRKNIYKKLKL